MFNASIIELEYGTQIDGTSQEYADMRDGITVMDLIARVLSGQDISTILGQRAVAAKAEEEARAAAAAKAEEEARAAENARAAARAEADVRRKRAEARNRFNQNAGLAFAIQGGMGIISEDIIGKRIFGEPEPAIEYETVKNKDTGATSTREKEPSHIGFPLDVLVGFQYSWFSINTGASFGFGYDGPSRIEYSFVQVPVLLRGEWDYADHFVLNAFAGMGFNVPLKATAALAQIQGGSTTTQDATLTIPPSVILGAGLGVNFGAAVVGYTDLRFVFDLAETEAKLADGRTGSFKRTSFDLILGLKFRVGFPKRNRYSEFNW
jgi:hypothetical protein